MPRFSPAAEWYVRDAENAWNMRNLDAILLAHSIDCQWRNRVEFLWGREQIRAFLDRKLHGAIELRVILEPWVEAEGRLSLRLAAEYHSDSGTWFRAFCNEEIEFDHAGLVRRRLTSVNEHPIPERARLLRWPAGPRPLEHPGLSELGL